MDMDRKHQTTPVTSQGQSKAVTSGSDTQNDRMAQLEKARQRALEVRKQRAEEKKQLRQEEEESEKLRLQKVKLENEKLRKEIESAGKGLSPAPSSPKKKPEEGAPPPSPPKEPNKKRDRSPDDSELSVGEELGERAEADVPDPMTYVAQRIDHLTGMFEEEMNYKKKKREEKEKEAKKTVVQKKHDPAFTAYVSGMKKTREQMMRDHIFGS